MTELVYRNQNATRNLPLAERLETLLVEAGASVGIDAIIVISGGQPSAAEDPSGLHRTGSTRHDHGNAADIDLDVDGRLLNFADPEDRAVFQRVVSGDQTSLDDEEANSVLRVLNLARLALGARFGIDVEEDHDRLPEDSRQVLDYLGWIQEELTIELMRAL